LAVAVGVLAATALLGLVIRGRELRSGAGALPAED